MLSGRYQAGIKQVSGRQLQIHHVKQATGMQTQPGMGFHRFGSVWGGVGGQAQGQGCDSTIRSNGGSWRG